VEQSYSEVEPIKSATAASPAECDGAGVTILLVEDEDFVRAVTREVLLFAGYSVLAARNIAEALDIFARSDESISLLLTDRRLPGGDGCSLARQLIAVQPRIKTLVISGYPPNRTEIGASADIQGSDDSIAYLAKPFSTDTLLHAVRCALGAVQPSPLAKSAAAS
jgi:CheY-like chemotaxis protein